MKSDADICDENNDEKEERTKRRRLQI